LLPLCISSIIYQSIMPKYTRLSFALITAALLLMATCYRPIWKQSAQFGMFAWDAYTYYSYLPAAFIYHDLKHHRYADAIGKKYGTNDLSFEVRNGNKVVQYACGQAVMESPWFALGHLTAKIGGYPADGFSMPYNLWVEFGLIAWALFGVYFLGKVLSRYFDDLPVAVTLFGLTIGTNYLPYATHLNTYTHTPLFTVYALLLWVTILFYEKPTFSRAALIGGLVGLATLTRPTEAIALFIPLLWGVSDRASLVARMGMIRQHLPKLGLAVALTLLIGSVQLCYWKYLTGHFIFYSYGSQTFSFLKPHLYSCLLSARKGWLTYSPMVVFSLIGFYYFWKKNPPFTNFDLKNNRFALTLVAFLTMWITFSWDIWWYGGGIGQRAMIQYLPIYAFPFAAFAQYCFAKPIAKWVFAAFAMLFLYHNIWVTHGATRGGYINTSDCNDALFFDTLWQWHKTDNTTECLLDNSDNKKILTNPKLVYSNDLEQDTTANATNENIIGGKKSIRVDVAHPYSAMYLLPVPTTTKCLQLKMQINPRNREWTDWRMPQAILSFKNNYNQPVKTVIIRMHRALEDQKTADIQLTARAPQQPFDHVELSFWNADSQSTTIIDNLQLFVSE
jgi:hypothetical protein